jgi:hypothetical protein
LIEVSDDIEEGPGCLFKERLHIIGPDLDPNIAGMI